MVGGIEKKINWFTTQLPSWCVLHGQEKVLMSCFMEKSTIYGAKKGQIKNFWLANILDQFYESAWASMRTRLEEKIEWVLTQFK